MFIIFVFPQMVCFEKDISTFSAFVTVIKYVFILKDISTFSALKPFLASMFRHMVCQFTYGFCFKVTFITRTCMSFMFCHMFLHLGCIHFSLIFVVFRFFTFVTVIKYVFIFKDISTFSALKLKTIIGFYVSPHGPSVYLRFLF